MNLNLMPKTRLGTFSITFIFISIALLVGVMAIAANLEPGTTTGGFWGNMPLALMTLGALAGAVISFITGSIAVINHNERSILLFICLGIGALFIYFGITQVVGEITGT